VPRRAAAPADAGLPALRARFAARRALRALPRRAAAPYEATVAALAYDFPADVLIHALKFRGELALAPFLGPLLFQKTEHVDLIVPVPFPRTAARTRL